MKKLTAGIFTVLLGLVAANSADAAVASKGYVDDMVGVNTTAIATLGDTVAGHTQSIADLNAADTAINAKIGTVDDGKTLAGMIAEAKTEATYDDTAVRGLIGDNAEAISELETKVGDSSVAAQIDAVRATAITGLTDEQRLTMLPTVKLTEDMIQTSTNDLMFEVNKINDSDVMKSGITPDKVTAYEGYAAKITANETAAAGAQADADAAQAAADAAQADATANAAAIAAINNSENGLLKQAEAAAKSYADGAADAAETAAKSYADGAADAAETAAVATAKEYTDAEVKKVDDKLANYALNSTIGTVDEGKTVVEMIEAAQTAATYDDAEVRGLIATNKTATETNAAAIKTINEGAVMNSGISADKVSAYDAYAGTIAANKTATETNAAAIAANTAAAAAAKSAADEAQADADAAQGAAEAAQQTADSAIPKPTGECTNAKNKCVLTFNNAQYAWEVIERNGDGE